MNQWLRPKLLANVCFLLDGSDASGFLPLELADIKGWHPAVLILDFGSPILDLEVRILSQIARIMRPSGGSSMRDPPLKMPY